eukprot:gene45006-55056_t
MEGGFLPWRTQKIDCNSPDLDSYGKPLPPPPVGYFWERLEDGSWILKRYDEQEVHDGRIQFTQPSVIEHVVMPEDTLPGLCLRYNVTATDVRRMNIFSGNNIHFKKSLRIPIQSGAFIQPQSDTLEVKVQKFKNATGESNKEAHIYLEEHNYDVDKAIAAWKGDENWAKDHPETGAFSAEVPDPVVAPFAIENVREVAPLVVTESLPITSYAGVYDGDPTLEPLLS